MSYFPKFKDAVAARKVGQVTLFCPGKGYYNGVGIKELGGAW